MAVEIDSTDTSDGTMSEEDMMNEIMETSMIYIMQPIMDERREEMQEGDEELS